MNIKKYYANNFRKDLCCFMPDPQLPYFGHSWSHDCKNLEKISIEERAFFLICLYFSVLVDQAMYTYYPSSYTYFEKLTIYPKFCHGLGQFHKNPQFILSAPIDQSFVEFSSIETHLQDGMNLFVDEVDTFFEKYMPVIEVEDFFKKLIYDPDIQIPELVVIVNKEIKNDIVYKVYKAIKVAVNEKYPQQN